MTYANIKLKTHTQYNRKDQTEQPMLEPVILPLMQPFVEALALKYPQWEFVECDSRAQWSSDGRYYHAADGFVIMDKREELGKIRIDHWCRAGSRYWVDNFRIDAQRSRGSGFKTKHMDKAVKYVAKYFGSRNVMEIMDASEEAAGRVLSNVVSNLQVDVRYKWRRLDSFAAAFLMQNWGEFASYVRNAAAGQTAFVEAAEQYPAAYTHETEALKISDLVDKGKAWLVNTSNSSYIVKQGGTVSIGESEQLPNIVRRNLGMLKLVQDREIISNVGLRVDETTYYVIGEQDEEHRKA